MEPVSAVPPPPEPPTAEPVSAVPASERGHDLPGSHCGRDDPAVKPSVGRRKAGDPAGEPGPDAGAGAGAAPQMQALPAAPGFPETGLPAGAAPWLQALLATAGGFVRDTHVQERFGDLGPAFSAASGSWFGPFAAAMHGLEPTAHSRAAARALTGVAQLTGAFARDVAGSLARSVDTAGAGRPHARYTGLAARIDDVFREFSSSPEFDRARRAAAAAVLDWLEHDHAAAAAVARVLESPPAPAQPQPGDAAPARATAVMRDGNATLLRYASGQAVRSSVLMVPGFTADARIFDLGPECSVTNALASQGIETWVLEWGRSDETDRSRTVANQIERIDRAVGVVRAAANGRPPALAGHFHGGLLALLYCIRHPGRVGALVTLSTPVEFASRRDVFGDWLRACDGERLVDVLGNVPGALVTALLAATSPMRWCGGTFFALLDGASSTAAARAARFERACRFPPAFPGETFRRLYRTFYRDNAFFAGGAVLDGRRYDPSELATPVLNVYARDDRIVPLGASARLETLVPAPLYSSREHPGGHYGLLAGHAAHTGLLSDTAAWLIGHTAGT